MFWALKIVHCHLIILKIVFGGKRHYSDTAFAKYRRFFNSSSLMADARRCLQDFQRLVIEATTEGVILDQGRR